ncbi:MAG: hypothetical protein PHP42_07680 [Bacteroidota bacterium]|nr:hypothetical protein [Bacteroidota bacterium]
MITKFIILLIIVSSLTPLYGMYVDPGVGSYVYQAVIALVTGVIFYFRSIKIFIGGLFAQKNDKNKF